MNFKKLFRCSPKKNVVTFPKGTVIACWSKNVIDKNGIGIKEWEGWALCDGREGRPDFRNRFLAGAGEEPSPIKLGTPGGRKKVKLTLDNLPKHTHVATIEKSGAHSHAKQKTAKADNDDNDGVGYYVGAREDESTSDEHLVTITDTDSAHDHEIKVSSTGKNLSFEIMPPYTGIYYMIKI